MIKIISSCSSNQPCELLTLSTVAILNPVLPWLRLMPRKRHLLLLNLNSTCVESLQRVTLSCISATIVDYEYIAYCVKILHYLLRGRHLLFAVVLFREFVMAISVKLSELDILLFISEIPAGIAFHPHSIRWRRPWINPVLIFKVLVSCVRGATAAIYRVLISPSSPTLINNLLWVNHDYLRVKSTLLSNVLGRLFPTSATVA